MTFTHEFKYPYQFIHIDSFLHLKFVKREFIGLQSYVENSTLFCIELNFKNNTIILLEYDDFEKWGQILKILEEI